jgi:excisionase family DNA binding protein
MSAKGKSKEGARQRTLSREEARAKQRAIRRTRALTALEEDLALTVEEAATLLGLSRAHIYNLVAANATPFPVIKIGRSIRIPTNALREALQIPRSPSPEAAPRRRKQRAVSEAGAPPTP